MKTEFYENGDFCITDAEGACLQGQIRRDFGLKEIHVAADETITVDKMFGPLVFFPIRVTADLDSGDWVIERQSGDDGSWSEAARIPGQTAEDYPEDIE